jgi:hypothetical protein
LGGTSTGRKLMMKPIIPIILESLAALPRMAVVRLIIFKDLNYIVVLSRFCSMVVDFHVLIFVFFTSDIFLSWFRGGCNFDLYHLIWWVVSVRAARPRFDP